MKHEKQECPNSECGSSDAYGYDSEKGHCFSCDCATVATDFGWKLRKANSKKWTPIKGYDHLDSSEGSQVVDDMAIPESMGGTSGNPSVPQVSKGAKGGSYEALRGITEDTMEFYGVKTEDSNVQRYVYPNGAVKTRYISEKEFTITGKIEQFFGQNLFPPSCSRKLTITEGELDAMSAYQMLNTGSYLNPVVSIPSGNPSAKFWKSVQPYLESFDEIILSADSDEVGFEWAMKLTQTFPDRVLTMNHGDFKDANEFLMAGKGKAYQSSWWKPKKLKPKDVLSDTNDYLDMFRASQESEYFKTGIPELDDKMLGISKGFLTLIQAVTGAGKSEFMRYLEHVGLTTTDYVFATCKKEETPLRTLLGQVTYRIGQNVTLKQYVEEKGLTEEVEACINEIANEERFITFDIDETEDAEQIMGKLKYLVNMLSVDFIFIEPIQDIVTGDASTKEGKLSDLISQMASLAAKSNVGIVVIAHENSNGGAMYSSMITKKAGFKITLSGDREHEDPKERNKTYLKVEEKNRSGRGFGDAGVVSFDLDRYVIEPMKAKESPKGRAMEEM